MNGPALAVRGPRVAVAWFTHGATDRPAVQLAVSSDGGASFPPPVVVDGDGPLGRVDVALLSDGSAVVTWLARPTGGRAALCARRYPSSGPVAAPVELARVRAARTSGFPQVAALDDGAVAAWTGDDRRVRLARLTVQ